MSNSNKNLNIRQKINLSDRDANLVVLEQHGIVSSGGNLTDLGRRIQADLVFRGGNGDMEEVVDAVLGVYRAEKAVKDILESVNTEQA